MKKALPHVVLWSALFLLCAVLLSRLTVRPEESTSPLREYYPVADRIDVVFFGASQVFCGISPAELYREYGISAYDMANGNQYMSTNYFLIREVLRVSDPELIVVDISTVNRAPEDGDWSHRQYLATMERSPLWWEAYRQTRVEGESALSYLFPILRYHDRWPEMRLSSLQGGAENSERPAGQMLVGSVIPQAETTEYPFVDDGQMAEVEERHAYWLEQIIELCAQEGQPLLLTKVPGRAENWSAQVANTMAQFTAKKQATFVDMDRCFEQTGVDMSTDTLDGSTHLNMYGARALSHWLGGYLRENYDLPDRRGQAEYDAVWTPILKEYDELWKRETENPTGW
ncbi:hypothetical protein [Candidatus Allofournierella merdipullorum]|uniref:hypothetical protein n=1 Tax=Candidatus Allofournierella merdipullorum TaxID=2838595 RepID=UPI003AB3FD27